MKLTSPSRIVPAIGFFVASGALALIMSSCTDRTPTAPSLNLRPAFLMSSAANTPKTFFGHMIPGGALLYSPPSPPDSSGHWASQYNTMVIIPIGTLRAWDGGWQWYLGESDNPGGIVRASGIHWEGVDAFLNLAQRLNVTAMYVFGGPLPDSATRAWPECPLPRTTQWREFLHQLLTHADTHATRFTIFEMWNEAPNCWTGPQTADTLFALAKIGYDSIKAHNPSAIVLTPSFNMLATPSGATATQQYFDVMKAQKTHGITNADGIAFHTYAADADKVTDYNTIKGIASARGFGTLPIYLTETAGDSHLILTSMASAGAAMVVWDPNTGGDDLNSQTGLGLTWTNTYNQMTSQPLSVFVSGPQYIPRYQSSQYTATPQNGVAPYTYQWHSRYNYGTWSNWAAASSLNYTYASVNSCGISSFDLQVMVHSNDGQTVTSSAYHVGISNPC